MYSFLNCSTRMYFRITVYLIYYLSNFDGACFRYKSVNIDLIYGYQTSNRRQDSSFTDLEGHKLIKTKSKYCMVVIYFLQYCNINKSALNVHIFAGFRHNGFESYSWLARQSTILAEIILLTLKFQEKSVVLFVPYNFMSCLKIIEPKDKIENIPWTTREALSKSYKFWL